MRGTAMEAQRFCSTSMLFFLWDIVHFVSYVYVNIRFAASSMSTPFVFRKAALTVDASKYSQSAMQQAPFQQIVALVFLEQKLCHFCRTIQAMSYAKCAIKHSLPNHIIIQTYTLHSL